MTATDELRRLLDERGVEWHISNEKGVTFWTGQFGIGYYARQNDDGETLHMLGVNLTPEQAIAATLGGGTCHNVSTTGNFRCSECDAADLDFDKPSFCHGCGRRVIDVR